MDKHQFVKAPSILQQRRAQRSNQITVVYDQQQDKNSPTPTNQQRSSYTSSIVESEEPSFYSSSAFPNHTKSSLNNYQKNINIKDTRTNRTTSRLNKCLIIIGLVFVLIALLTMIASTCLYVLTRNGSTTVATTTSTTTTTTTTSTSISTTTTTPLCTSQTYSELFTNAVAPSAAQCTAWATFRASLTCSNYSLLQFYGSLLPAGINVTDPTVVNAIAAALFNYTNYGPTTSNGYPWAVDPSCAGGELTAGATCSCTSGYAVRPCIGDSSWGTLSGSTSCGAVTQTITVTFS